MRQDLPLLIELIYLFWGALGDPASASLSNPSFSYAQNADFSQSPLQPFLYTMTSIIFLNETFINLFSSDFLMPAKAGSLRSVPTVQPPHTFQRSVIFTASAQDKLSFEFQPLCFAHDVFPVPFPV